MKKLLLSTFIFSCGATFAQWAYTGNNSSNDVTYAFGKTFCSDGLISNTSGLYVSTDNASTWNPSNTGVPATGLVFGANDGTNLYAFRSNSVYASTTGNNWSAQASTVPSSLTIKSMAVFNGTTMAIASPNSPASIRVLHYTAGSWSIKSSPTNSVYGTCIRNLNGTLFAGTTASSVIKSTDGGVTWTGSSVGTPTQNIHKYVQCLANSGNTFYAGTIGGRILKSTDGGATWANSYNIGDDNGFYSINDFYIFNGTTVLAATDSGFVYTTNSGSSWTRYNNGLNFGNFENLMKRITVSGAYIVAGVNTSASARVVRLPLSAVGLTPPSGLTEQVLSTEVNVYPNPSSGVFTLDLNYLSEHVVKIHDAAGREILSTKVNGGTAQLNLENYSKGLYTYTVYNNNIVVSRGKLIRN